MQTHTAKAVEDTVKVAKETVKWSYHGLESVLHGDGILITLVGVLVVFSGLVILLVAVKLAHAGIHARQKSARKEQPAQTNGVSGEVIAAIGFALNEFLNRFHDDETTIMTIQRISRHYSPWSSKLHNMTRPPINISKR